MTVELFGMARALTGVGAVSLVVDEPIELGTVLAALAERHPELVGRVLDSGTFAPLEPHIVLLDGRRKVSLDERITSADKPCLLLVPSGG